MDRKRIAEDAISSLRQGRKTVAEYAEIFNGYRVDVTWDDDPLSHAFEKGLNDDIKDMIANLEPVPTLQAAVTRATHYDRRCQERRSRILKYAA